MKTLDETCRADEFTCDNKHCIQRGWVCDKNDDCGDNSDEKNCPPTTCKPGTEFTCSDKSCVPLIWKCDGDSDCSDGSDEIGCKDRPQGVIPNHCADNEFACGDHITCIHHSWVCDGDSDCLDNSDESPSKCHTGTCRPDQFQCSDKSCISGNRIKFVTFFKMNFDRSR